MSREAEAMIHLFDRLAELDREARPARSPRTVVDWTAEDIAAVRVLIEATAMGISDEHIALLRSMAVGG